MDPYYVECFDSQGKRIEVAVPASFVHPGKYFSDGLRDAICAKIHWDGPASMIRLFRRDSGTGLPADEELREGELPPGMRSFIFTAPLGVAEPQRGPVPTSAVHLPVDGSQRGSVPTSAGLPAGGTSAGSASDVSGPVLNVDCDGFEVSATGGNERCLSLLSTIIANIMRPNADPKMRTLRLDNATLQNDVLSRPGALRFLKSVGFVEAVDPRGAPVLQWQGEDKGLSVSRLSEAMEALDRVRSRDSLANENATAYRRCMQGTSMELRAEAWAKSDADLHDSIKHQFARVPEDDALASLETLETILRNAISGDDPRYRTLKWSNAIVRRMVLSTPGALDVLVPVGGFSLSEEGLRASSDAAKMMGALQLVGDVKRYCMQLAQEERQRAVSLGQQELLRERAQMRRELAPPAPSPPHPDRESDAPESGRTSRRVPISEALAVLMGRRTVSEDD